MPRTLETGTKVTCVRCGYSWNYRGRLWYTSCQKCGKLQNIREPAIRDVTGRD